MIAKLLVIAGPDRGKSFEIVPNVPTVLGRSREADVTLNDPRVSPFHCRIEVRLEELFAVDLDSTCGTAVNDVFVLEYTLQFGDTLKLGDTILLVQDPDAPEQPRPAATAQSQPAKPVAKPAPPKPAAKAPAPVKAAVAEGSTKTELPDRPENLPGHILATYKVGAILSRGRSGFIFKANSIKDGRAVALKVFTHLFASNDKNKETFTKAMKLCMPLRHTNIVPVVGAGKSGPYLWMAMELVSGESLTTTIRNVGVAGSLDWRRALRMAIHLSRGLNYLHEQKVVYRSVGPQNILCEGEGRVPRLSDFMRARPFFDPVTPGTGTEEMPDGLLLYIAPEQTREELEIDSRSDIFNLGSLLYQLLTGHPPFEGGSLAETITKIRREKPEDPRKYQLAVPQSFAGVVLQMLSKRPEDRYQTMAEVQRDLERTLKYQGMDL